MVCVCNSQCESVREGQQVDSSVRFCPFDCILSPHAVHLQNNLANFGQARNFGGFAQFCSFARPHRELLLSVAKLLHACMHACKSQCLCSVYLQRLSLGYFVLLA